MKSAGSLLPILTQHLEDAACLRTTRSYLVRAPHVKLKHLARLDERIAAHLDGIAVAGRVGAQMSMQALDRTGKGELFTAAVGCIEAHSEPGLMQLIALGQAVPAARRGLHSAFGWVSANRLQDTAAMLLGHTDPAAQLAGLAACAQHRVDPKRFLDTAIDSPTPPSAPAPCNAPAKSAASICSHLASRTSKTKTPPVAFMPHKPRCC